MVRRVLILVIAAIAAFVYIWGRAEQSERRANEALKQARAALDSARAETGSSPRGVFLSTDEIGKLKRAGLTDPVNQLRSDLESQGSLISIPGVLGGKMGFYDRDGVVLLPGNYVYAPAEDGHILVHALLRYDVEPGGKIRWKLIEAKRD